jgi:hypothetical protein
MGYFIHFICWYRTTTAVAVVLLGGLFYNCSTVLAIDEYGFRERSEIIIDHTADIYIPPSMSIGDPEKYYWPKAMARFEKYGIDDGPASEWIEQLKERSPFHFTLVGMARLMSLYGHAPAIGNNKLLLLQRVFERSDSHNPWTSEGTENHIAMDRTSGYLFAQHALEYPQYFPDAPQKLVLLKDWISRWSKRMYQYGTGEWNSSTYQAYHIIGWLNLYDFADDPEVKEMARAVLDYYAAEMALHYSWGTYGGSEKRGRGVGNINLSASNYLCWLWFGSHYSGISFLPGGNEYIQSMHAVTSSYRPPPNCLPLARKESKMQKWYCNSKPSYLYEKPAFVKQFFYVDEDFTLGTAISPYGGWTGATSQIVNWKLAVKRDESPVPFEISGNGRFHDNWSGSAGNPWTQFAQHKNVLVQLTRTPVNKNELIKKVEATTEQWAVDWQKDFSARFPNDNKRNVVNFAGNIVAENLSFLNLPMEAHLEFANGNCFADLGNVFLFISLIGTDEANASKNLTERSGRKILTDQAPEGQLCGFVMEVFPAKQWDSFETFRESYVSDYIQVTDGNCLYYRSLEGEVINVSFSASGTFCEALYDWGYGAVEQQTFVSAPPFRQPHWPGGEGYGKIPVILVNGETVAMDKEWPVYRGPGFALENGIMVIKGVQSVYRVDYSGRHPVFSITPR